MIKNGLEILDNNNLPLHAHGGEIIHVNNIYYWIGEDRRGRNKVSCYSSSDLTNWTFENTILSLDSPTKKHYFGTDLRLEIDNDKASIGEGCNIERPKILYNEKIDKYVMWMHWEKPSDYSEARCAIAISDTIAGDYTYLGSFNPIGHMSRDCTLFKDDDGSAYFITSSRGNADLHIYRLSDDYLSIDEHVRTLWPGQFREAPAVFKKDNLYYMLTSACSGWDPNQSCYAYSESIDGKWSMLKNLGDETTYRSQPTSVLPVKSENSTSYLYIGDRWGGEKEKYFTSTYMFLPIEFGEKSTISIQNHTEVEIDLVKNKIDGIK
ncbi:MAG: family 43 glycosylhydrolase [Spirochaetaceae bacterium]